MERASAGWCFAKPDRQGVGELAGTQPSSPIKLGVLVSGQGTNLQAILDAIACGQLHARVALVVCNRPGAPAVAKAEAAGVPVEIYELKNYPSRLAKQQAIACRLMQAGVDLIVCAGWDRVLCSQFIRQFDGRIINVHPSLLPAFGGSLHAVRQALEYGVRFTGCTVHFVTDQVDAGPIILQAVVPVLPCDTEHSLTERIHAQEHHLLVEAIRLFAQGRLEIQGRVVRVKAEQAYRSDR